MNKASEHKMELSKTQTGSPSGPVSAPSGKRRSRREIVEAPPAVQRGERGAASRMLGLAAVIALMITGAASFFILIGLTPIAPTGSVVTTALAINSLLASILLFLIGREVWIIVQARRKGRAAARLHVRIISLFALVAAIPAILVAIVASMTLEPSRSSRPR